MNEEALAERRTVLVVEASLPCALEQTHFCPVCFVKYTFFKATLLNKTNIYGNFLLNWFAICGV